MNPLQNQLSMLGNSLGRPAQKPFVRPQRAQLNPSTLANYMPVAGRARAVYQHTPEEIAHGARAFRAEIAQHSANMAQQARQAQLQAQQALRNKMAFLQSSPESRALARIQQYMTSKGQSMGNAFNFKK